MMTHRFVYRDFLSDHVTFKENARGIPKKQNDQSVEGNPFFPSINKWGA